ncbi:MAG: multicopper oxidase domain-containing protein [Ilumatobacter sp.]|jgi:nitrite reductase (NO-forming)|uniref:plastocyanin/azurin family copper-binding protein n=4 Tax=Ilumatobacter sp. TaxID=1967498 RepID=UPI001DAF7612|nr:multicopper oxidase domain-containing protein [Ilumatobacter sp.]MBT5275062.1 multicopper oxidase domain-containing protein [Ilumatobacter sp.]MDG0976449.1 plastocyanin/azurin family copper-binding protein [Ilumatobacter sp.]MDG1390525.1 plastocyanin/azurin family copper-binding protein [Ilumatobacter sp.]
MTQHATGTQHPPVGRRRFLATLGGGAAVVGLAACDADGPDGPGTAFFDEDHPVDASAGAVETVQVTQAVAPTFDDRSDSIIPALTRLADLSTADKSEERMAYAPLVPERARRSDQRIVEFDIDVIEGECVVDPANNVSTLMWGFRIGGGGAAGTTVAPGESATINARLLYPGAFMYHCAFGDVPEHITHGMYGMFIVDPETPLPDVDHEWAIMQSEWYLGEPNEDGVAEFDRDRLELEHPTYVTFNGRTDALVDDNSLQMQVGERSRFYMVNEGLNLDANFHPIGSHWDVVYPEAATHPVNRVIRGSQSTLVVAGGGTVTELVGHVPSTIILVDHALVRTFYKGCIGLVVVTGDDNAILTVGDDGLSAAADNEPAAPAGAGDPNTVLIPAGAYDPANADTAYSPQAMSVAVGTTVTWINEDSVFHTITSGGSNGTTVTPNGEFDSGEVQTGETYAHTFDTPGTFDYYCTPHPWMIGQIEVTG